MKIKRITCLLAAAAFATACSESEDTDNNAVECNKDVQVNVITDNLFTPVSDDLVTHQRGFCSASEHCITVYGTENAPVKACSRYEENKYLMCGVSDDGNVNKVDATTNNDHCGACNNKCSDDKTCVDGKCESHPSNEDPGNVPTCQNGEVMCSYSDGVLRICNANTWLLLETCPNGCDKDRCNPEDTPIVPPEDPNLCGGKTCGSDELCIEKVCEKLANLCGTTKCSNGQVCDPITNACVNAIDTDGDGTPDDTDLCPFNPKISNEKNKSCFPLDNDVLHIYSAENLLELAKIATGKNADNPDLKDFSLESIKTIKFEKDINLSTLSNTSVEANECIVYAWEDYKEVNLTGITIDGNKKTIKSTAKNGTKRCSLPNTLFNELKDVSINDLTLDYDMKGSGRALLANVVRSESHANTVRNITFSGTVISDSTLSVGGLFAETTGIPNNNGNFAYGSRMHCQLDNIFPTNVTVEAPKATDVGGIIGTLIAASILLPSDKTLKINHVIGLKNVGGIVGNNEFNSYTIEPIDSGYIHLLIRYVKGDMNVGGFSGTGKAQNTILVGDHVEGTSTSVGGMRGYPGHTVPAPGGDVIKRVAVQLRSVKGKDRVGGITGTSTQYGCTHDVALARITESIEGQNNVGGFSGYLSCSETTFSTTSVSVPKITGKSEVAGFIGYFDGNVIKTFRDISVHANIDAEEKIGGLIGSYRNLASINMNRVFVASSRFIKGNKYDMAAVSSLPMLDETILNLFYYADNENTTPYDGTEQGTAIAVKDADLTDSSALLEGWTTQSFDIATDKQENTRSIKLPTYKLDELEKELNALVAEYEAWKD